MIIKTYDDYIEVVQKSHERINGCKLDDWVLEENKEILEEQFREYKESGETVGYDEVRNLLSFIEEEYA